MSLNLLKSQEDNCLKNPEPLSADSTRTQQKRWMETQSFNLHKISPLCRLEEIPKHQTIIKKMTRKYYGKKILYVTELRELNCALISRAKLLKYAYIEENQVYPNSWKYKGNRVILGAKLKFQREKFWDERVIRFKKILKYCKKAKIMILSHLGFLLLKNMHFLKELKIDLSNILNFDFLGKSVRNLRNLEALNVDYRDEEYPAGELWRRKNLAPQKSKSELFSLFHKLRSLKEVKITIDDNTLKAMNLDKDLEKFYSKPLNFNFLIEIDGDYAGLDQRENSNLNKILAAAEYLSLGDSRAGAEEEAVHGKGNNVVLYFPSIILPEGYSDYGENKFTSPLLTILCQIIEKCHSLQYFSLFFSTFKFANTKLQRRFPEEWSSLREKLNAALEEISTFDKLKQFELATIPNDLKIIPLGKILSNKSLEIFRLGLGRKWDAISSPEQGECFAVATATASQMKEFSMRIDAKLEFPLFGTNLFSYIQRLDGLEVFELVHQNLEVITFDFLYGLVTSLLDKKNMRKILICAKVTNNFYAESFGTFLSKSLGEKLQDMLNEVSHDWERRVKVLKDLQLEEILVGKLDGYSFSYLFFGKDMQITEKFFWTEKEMKKLLDKKPQLVSQYEETFYFFKEETSTW